MKARSPPHADECELTLRQAQGERLVMPSKPAWQARIGCRAQRVIIVTQDSTRTEDCVRAHLPTVTVTRYVTPLREGGSLPAIVEADDLGTYVLKFRGAG